MGLEGSAPYRRARPKTRPERRPVLARLTRLRRPLRAVGGSSDGISSHPLLLPGCAVLSVARLAVTVEQTLVATYRGPSRMDFTACPVCNGAHPARASLCRRAGPR